MIGATDGLGFALGGGVARGWDGSGNDGSTIFRPLASVNRDAMAAFMVRWMNRTGYDGS